VSFVVLRFQTSDNLAVIVAPMKAEYSLLIWNIVRNETGFTAVAELSCARYAFAF
jgi:hypothetical protein